MVVRVVAVGIVGVERMGDIDRDTERCARDARPLFLRDLQTFEDIRQKGGAGAFCAARADLFMIGKEGNLQLVGRLCLRDRSQRGMGARQIVEPVGSDHFTRGPKIAGPSIGTRKRSKLRISLEQMLQIGGIFSQSGNRAQWSCLLARVLSR